MRFETIEIRNYRQYKNIKLDFEKTKENDLHIIVASNGTGKTNLLNAINWCLYGDEPHLGDVKDGLSICNITALNEASENGVANVEVTVKILAENDGEKYELIREANVRSDTGFANVGPLKIFYTDLDGRTKILEAEAAKDIVNQYLPEKIRQYFFFDGEQLSDYFDLSKRNTHVKDSIYEIAQINAIKKVREHLDSICGEYKKNIGDVNPEIQELEAKKNEYQITFGNNNDTILQLETSNNDAENRINELTKLISGTEGVVEDNNRYENNVKQIEILEEKLEELQRELRTFVRKYAISLYLYDFNKATHEYIEDKYLQHKLPPKINVDMIKESLEKHECALCGRGFTVETEEKLINMINEYELSSDVSHRLIEIKSDINREYKKGLRFSEDKEKLLSEIKQIEDEIKRLNAENQELHKRMAACSSVEQIGFWVNEREGHREAIKTNSKKIGSFQTVNEEITNKIGDIDKKLAKLVDKEQTAGKAKRNLEYATRAKSIMGEIETEIVNDVKSRMETETMQLFDALVWKKNTYGHIELGNNYEMKLYHKQTNDMCLGTCSAAERQLLALAFTIALHKVSGHESLIFIDTPVGRVSDTNRENFAKALIEVSKSKQMIFAFTPSEFSDEISRYFNENVISSKLTLKSNNEETTEIEVV